MPLCSWAAPSPRSFSLPDWHARPRPPPHCSSTWSWSQQSSSPPSTSTSTSDARKEERPVSQLGSSVAERVMLEQSYVGQPGPRLALGRRRHHHIGRRLSFATREHEGGGYGTRPVMASRPTSASSRTTSRRREALGLSLGRWCRCARAGVACGGRRSPPARGHRLAAARGRARRPRRQRPQVRLTRRSLRRRRRVAALRRTATRHHARRIRPP